MSAKRWGREGVWRGGFLEKWGKGEGYIQGIGNDRKKVMWH